ncbi:LOW QUALITY PROTEIN: hypothetical protein PanWU01x14_177710 [Parasponia andersonii]|uniref:Transmembrane protein n=1 Tax=Parasponia andersonii TaxID=3476 RepID=A0A2P5C7D3_PARAD|nr:LOW QUALITY PROTEIN: hypothetical protein PanWU01x14_177710 [Parasponia andersonii]
MKLVKQRNAMRANLKPHLKAAMFEVVVFFLFLLLLLLHGLVKDMSFLYTHYTQYKLAECFVFFFFFFLGGGGYLITSSRSHAVCVLPGFETRRPKENNWHCRIGMASLNFLRRCFAFSTNFSYLPVFYFFIYYSLSFS